MPPSIDDIKILLHTKFKEARERAISAEGSFGEESKMALLARNKADTVAELYVELFGERLV